MIALYFLALFALSQSANIAKLSHAPPDILGFWRLFGAVILLAPFGIKKWREMPKWDFKTYIWPVLSAAFLFVHLWTYVYSAQNTTIAHCMIIFAINPLFSTIGAYLFLGETLTKRSIPAYLFGLLGIYLLVSQSLHSTPGQIWGDLSALLSALLFAIYILTGKKARHQFTNTHLTLVTYLITAIMFFVNGSAASLDFFHLTPLVWGCILGLLLLPTLLGHALFSYLMRYMNVGLMTCGKLVEPLLSVFMAYVWFGEKLSLWTFLSFLCTVTALIILFWPELSTYFATLRVRKNL